MRPRRGFTLIEVLVAMAIFATVLALVSAGIVQALRLQALNEANTTLQAKLRRVTEVISQDLRSAVFGGVLAEPYASNATAISFALAAGGVGYQVLPGGGGSFPNRNNLVAVVPVTSAAETNLQGRRALMVNADGEAIEFTVTNVVQLGGANSQRYNVVHAGCNNTIRPQIGGGLPMIHSRARSGVALLTALALLVVVGGIAALMFARTLGEIRHSGDDSGIVQSLLLARGAANLGGAVLQGPVRDELDAIVQVASSTTSRWSFGTGGANSDAPSPASVVQVLTTNADSVANQLQDRVDLLLCGATVPGLPDGEQLRLRIHVTTTACGLALPGGVSLPAGRFVGGLPRDGSGSPNDQTYGIPFVIVAEGEVGPYLRNVVTSASTSSPSAAAASPSTRCSRTSTARRRATRAATCGSPRTRCSTDPCTRTRTSASTGTPGSGDGSPAPAAPIPTPTRAPARAVRVPTARSSTASTTGTASRSATCSRRRAPPTATGTAPMPRSSWPASTGAAPSCRCPTRNQTQRDAAVAGGIAFPRPLESLVLRATNDAGVTVPADGSVAATRQYVEACYLRNANNINNTNNLNRRVCQTYEVSADGSMRMRERWTNVSGTTVFVDTDFTPVGGFNGVIYVPGGIDRFAGPDRTVAADPETAPPALASFAQITVAATGQIRITRDLTYEDVPCSGTPMRVGGAVVPATCDGLEAQNVLGVYSQGGDVLMSPYLPRYVGRRLPVARRGRPALARCARTSARRRAPRRN
jgi:prepilin-type N-terminal cleavage/methylation domain-containing protein